MGLLIGGGIGLAIGRAGKYSTGACPLTGNPYLATILILGDGKPIGEPVEGYGGEAHLRQMVEGVLSPTARSALPPS